MPSLPRFRRPLRSGLRQLGLTLAALLFGGIAPLQAAPDNLGLGLKELVEAHETAARLTRRATLSAPQFEAVMGQFSSAQTDRSQRVLTEIHLSGRAPMAHVIAQCARLGCQAVATVEWYRSGLFSAWVPVGQAAAVAKLPGVSSVMLSPRPVFHVGATTSQGVKVLHSDVVNNTYKGAGVTVGVISDSFNANASASKTAAQDVASGDLPGAGNPDGYTTPVNVVQEDPFSGATDEGRAMCQIVHDVAPASPLAFATADGGGPAGLANNIIALATPVGQTYAGKPGAGCQVVCDDVQYANEPMFSDGVVAQAVDQATALGATYFSSAGNDGNSGYLAAYAPQTNNAASQTLLNSQGGNAYAAIPAAEQGVIASFHNFGTAANPVLAQKVLIPAGGASGGQLNFQWDDPFDRLTSGGESVSTDYDILVFSLSGGAATYQSTLSGTANNYGTNEAIEFPSASMAAGTQYEFVIVQTNRAPANAAIAASQARHIRWAIGTDSQQIVADFVTPASPNSFGHTAARTCNSMAAYRYDKALNTAAATYSPVVEAFSSNGSANIYFDSAGNRLATPETRKQPTFAAPDGVNTTFFGSDADGDGFPNFFGSSAASPHGAGCAALLLNAAAALSRPLAPADVRAVLINHVQGSNDQDPAVSRATLTLSGVPAATASVAFTALDHSLLADPYSLNVAFTGQSGQQLTSLTITLPTGFAFFAGSYPFTAGPATGSPPPTFTTPAQGTNTASPVTLNFSNFLPGDTLAFGVYRGIQVGTSNSYRFTSDTDILAGTTLSATVTGPNAGTYTGTLGNSVSGKWNYKSGYGLLDINAAVTALQNGN